MTSLSGSKGLCLDEASTDRRLDILVIDICRVHRRAAQIVELLSEGRELRNIRGSRTFHRVAKEIFIVVLAASLRPSRDESVIDGALLGD